MRFENFALTLEIFPRTWVVRLLTVARRINPERWPSQIFEWAAIQPAARGNLVSSSPPWRKPQACELPSGVWVGTAAATGIATTASSDISSPPVSLPGLLDPPRSYPIRSLEIFMFCPACGNNNLPGSVTCSKCGRASPASHATSPPKVSAVAQSNPAKVPSAAQTKQSKAAPVIAGATLAGMGDRAIATILDVAGAVVAVVGMWASVRWGGVTSNGFELHGTAAVVARCGPRRSARVSDI